MSILAFVDIDDCLIKLARKCNAQGDPVVFDRHGQPESYINKKQRALLNGLLASATVVPTTGRTKHGYKKVQLPFASYAIVSFGAVILTPEDSVEPAWYQHIAACVQQGAQEFSGVKHVACAQGWQTETVWDAGLPLYYKLRQPDASIQAIGEAAALLPGALPPAWTVHHNGRQCCILPPYVGKAHAVRWFLDNIASNPDLVIGLGDSLSDAPFMGLCDFALTPTDSQLFRSFEGKDGD